MSQGRLVKPPRVPMGTCLTCGHWPCTCIYLTEQDIQRILKESK